MESNFEVKYSPAEITVYRANHIQPLISQHAETDKRPYIHPIVAPDTFGVLTEDSPAHHPWQHGLYVGLNDVNGIGFWEEGLRGNDDGTFHPKPMAKPEVDSNRIGWFVETAWRGPDGSLMITEGQHWSFTDNGNTYEIDMAWSLKAETDLTFGEYPYGGLFLRMPFKSELGGLALNSNGQANEMAEGKSARWVAVSMPIEGRGDCAGIAIMDHPTNFRHPARWRVDRQLGVSPSCSIAGSWELSEGEEQTYRYRLYVYGGSTQVSEIEERWKQFVEEEQ